jgi:nitroimidazol reductase NimA-like FMN-containing flavoprotein (pyridoxamine 5'-phosphate oxidase superfamily)
LKQRDRVAMTPGEVAAVLAGSRKVQLATIGPGGWPHLVTMYYVLIDGKIAFWTYRASQKARNLARDPRISCLVESGTAYFDLRGVQVQGVVQTIEDQEMVREIGRGITAAIGPELAGGTGEAGRALDEYVERAARKRLGYIVEPQRIISWDHSKLIVRAGQKP